MILVIAEKPSVAQTIAAVLGAKEKKDGFLTGSGYIVSWCVGHLVGLAEAAAYGEQYKKWSYDSLPILPQEWKYTVSADKEKQFKTLKELMHRADVSEVVNACDAGREGELIFRFVYEMAGCKKPMRRLWISSMEDSAIKEGFSCLKNGRDYDPLFASALCRAKADWLIGINATRLFSVLYNHTLNVGRVQTPTLKMLVDRDAAITTFKKEKYYHVRLALSGAEAASERISNKAEADALKTTCEASRAVCTSLVKEKKTAAPPKLFDLTSLQREANRLFGYTAKQTLDLAQSLYEKRLLTYPRTDSAFLTDDMGDTAAGIIKLLCGKFSFMAGKDFTPELGKVLNSKKVSDHHAIIPTMELAKTDLAALPESERNILTLSGARLLMATAAPHTYAVCHRIFESYFDVEFIILLKEAVGNDVEELLFVIVPILSRQCGCNIFKLCFQYPVSGNTEGTLHRFHDIGAVFRRHLPRFQFRGRTANAGIRHIKHIAQIRFIPVHHKQSNAGRATLYISAVIFSVPVLIGLAKGRIGALSINHHLFRIGELIVAGHRSQKRSPVICVRGDFPNRFFC